MQKNTFEMTFLLDDLWLAGYESSRRMLLFWIFLWSPRAANTAIKTRCLVNKIETSEPV